MKFQVIIVDNSPISYAFHPENAIAVKTWFDDPNDSELLELIPLLEELAESEDIYRVLRPNYIGNQQMAKELYG
jgi:RNA polymerase II subunit A small phosphatase-like protein